MFIARTLAEPQRDHHRFHQCSAKHYQLTPMPDSGHDAGMNVPEVNLTACWLGIVMGIVSGMILGIGFLNDRFLGGYSSPRRRLFRLAHISFFGLAFLNLVFWLTVRLGNSDVARLGPASTAFLIGAATMPAVCVLTAFWKPARHAFALPVLSLLYGASATLFQLV
jgi:hypothetical protein